jgi:hypothetical protein
MTLYLLVLFELAAVLLIVACFCRATHTHKGNTKRPIRWIFSLLGVMACVSFLAPWFGYEPDGLATGLLSVLTLTQLVTSHYWHAGVPPQFATTQGDPPCTGH